MKNLLKSLANFQQEVPVIYKGTQGYGYSYADLPTIFDKINPFLQKNGLGFSQLVGENNITTILFHTETGETMQTTTNIPQGVQLKGMNDFQVLGSAITYIRRYALSSMLGLVTDKDTDAGGEQVKTIKEAVKDKIDLRKDHAHWTNVVQKLESGKVGISQVEAVYNLNPQIKNELLKIVKK